MGTALLIESDPELECPRAFPDADSKHVLGTMFGPRVELLERRLKLDLAPLKHCAVDVAGAEVEEFDSDASGCLAAIRSLKDQGARWARFFAF